MLLTLFAALVGCDADTSIPLQPGRSPNSGHDSARDTAQDSAPDRIDDSGAPALLPATCAELHAAVPDAPDGAYTLYVGGEASKPWSAWCQDMRALPQEYLSLDTRAGSANYAQYASENSGNAGVRTVYARIRVDPATLQVDVSDQRFATSTGRLDSSGTEVTSMPYGVAMSCAYGVVGRGNIDLSGTAFRVAADAFVVGGYSASGEVAYSADSRSVDLQGGGYCGWIAPSPGIYNPVNDAGGFLLQLIYVG